MAHFGWVKLELLQLGTFGVDGFVLVFFSFPAYYPVTAEGMNYFCVVLVVYVACMLIYWWFPIKKYACKYNFRGGQHNKEEVEFPHVCLTEW